MMVLPRTGAQLARTAVAQAYAAAGTPCSYRRPTGELIVTHVMGPQVEEIDGAGYPVGIPGRGHMAKFAVADVGEPQSGDTFVIYPEDDPEQSGIWEITTRDTTFVHSYHVRVAVRRTHCFAPEQA